MRKNPKSDYNEENFCYECGNIITADRHFCDKQCREGYANRHKGSDVVENLKKQTKFRKRIGLPHHIMHFPRNSGHTERLGYNRTLKP